MASTPARLSKISPPRLFDAYPRRRLFEQLDALRAHPAVWITGPPGAGKTTLVASYLEARKTPVLWYQVDGHDADAAEFFHYLSLGIGQSVRRRKLSLPAPAPESMADLTGFTRRYFRALFGQLSGRFVLVFDNYQEVDESSAFHVIIHEALAQVPEGINVVAISRDQPPTIFSRLRATRALAYLGWDDLRLTLEEARAIAGDALGDLAVDAIYERCDGWVSGLVLAMANPMRNLDAPDSLSGEAKNAVFDFFANILLAHATQPMRDMLKRTAFLPRFTVEMAEKISGNPQAGRLLDHLYRKHLFTYRKDEEIPVFQYHALFHDFLIARTREMYSESERRDLARLAGELLETNGQQEDAVERFIAAEDWENVTRLVLSAAPGLIHEGRGQTVRKWVGNIPEPVRAETPWLLYWSGVAGFEFDPVQVRSEFDQSFAEFNAIGDTAGVLLAWSWITKAIMLDWDDRYRLDPWIAWLDDYLKKNPEFPDAETEAQVAASMAGALFLRQLYRVDVSSWMDRAREAALHSSDTKFAALTAYRVAHYHFNVGDVAKAQLITQWCEVKAAEPEATSLVRIVAKVLGTFSAVIRADIDGGLKTMRDGLDEAECSGIHMFDYFLQSLCVYGCLLIGDSGTAAKLLQGILGAASGSKGTAFYEFHYLSAGQALQCNDFERAFEHAKLSIEKIDSIGSPYVRAHFGSGYLQILHALGNHDATLQELNRTYSIAVQNRSFSIQAVCLLIKAAIGFGRGETASALENLAQALRHAASRGLGVVLWWWRHQLLADLCVRALDAGIEVAYVRRLVRSMRLVPSEPPLGCERWPWPLRVMTLGAFEVLRDDEPIRFTGKAQQKPLEMLKALVASGGKGVKVSSLTASLWPEADGDAAHKSFDVTLHRLRKLLGDESAITLSESKLALDPHLVWVDAFAFEGLMERSGSTTPSHAATGAIEPEAEQALKLYRGHFLETEADAPWTLSLRERLRNKFRRLIRDIGGGWEQARQWRRAAEVYERGLELDNLAEEFYRRLMICHRGQGRTAEAMEVYRRCRQMLSVVLGVAPSAETQGLYASLREVSTARPSLRS